jgi:hypothetical protein
MDVGGGRTRTIVLSKVIGIRRTVLRILGLRGSSVKMEVADISETLLLNYIITWYQSHKTVIFIVTAVRTSYLVFHRQKR